MTPIPNMSFRARRLRTCANETLVLRLRALFVPFYSPCSHCSYLGPHPSAISNVTHKGYRQRLWTQLGEHCSILYRYRALQHVSLQWSPRPSLSPALVEFDVVWTHSVRLSLPTLCPKAQCGHAAAAASRVLGVLHRGWAEAAAHHAPGSRGALLLGGGAMSKAGHVRPASAARWMIVGRL